MFLVNAGGGGFGGLPRAPHGPGGQPPLRGGLSHWPLAGSDGQYVRPGWPLHAFGSQAGGLA